MRLKFVSFQFNTLTVTYHRYIPNTMEGVVYRKMLQERIVQAIQDDPVVTAYFDGLARIDIQAPPAPEPTPSKGKK